jgi:hypothetical protein
MFKDFGEFVVNYFTDKKKLNFLLKNELLKRDDISKCLDNYKILSWIKDIKNEKFTNVRVFGLLDLCVGNFFVRQLYVL